jgi:hypothetical protein
MTDQPFQPPTQPAAWQTGNQFGPPPPGAPALATHGYLLPQGPGGQPGRIRSTGLCILLTIVTLGIYPLFWYFQVHSEMRRHSGQGLGGGVALLIAFLIGFVMPYITSSEVGSLYAARGMRRPVSGATGLWYFPGMFLIVGPLVWFIKTNGALNAYWRSCGVR